MTGTSKALKRLGVTGLSAALMSTGLAAFTAVAANAVVYPTTTATSVAISPTSDTAANGECNKFTLTVAAKGASVSVNIQQSVPANAAGVAAGADIIGFCQPLASNPDAGPTATQAGPGTGVTTTGSSPSASQCTNTALAANTAGVISCDTTYTDTNTDGTIVIGVSSNFPGSMPVNAFGDANGNGAQDVNEPGATANKTWVANNPNANTNTVACTPASQSNPTGATATFVCTVKDSGGNALAGVTPHFGIASGPDAGAPANATCPATANGTGGGTAGQTTCSYNNNGQPGHDVINVWLETNGTLGQQTGEPSTSITADWVTAAPVGSQVTVACTPNPTGHFSDSALNDSTWCQDPLTDKAETLTATVVNGTPAAPVAGVLVQWAIVFNAGGTGESATDVETLSSSSCLTDASGKCSITLNDSTPTDGEDIEVEATLPRQAGGPTFAAANKLWVVPVKSDARNIAVAPKTATQTSGGAQTLEATVTDRFSNGVPGVLVDWTESGPGAFRNQNTCTTGATGKCSVEVDSLTTESGDETVTATIDAVNSYGAGVRLECESAIGFSTTDFTDNYNPGGGSGTNAKGGNNPALTAPTAGNCADTSTVTWSAAGATGPATVTVTAPAGKVGHVETATATVKDAKGAGVPNAVVTFTVSGANNASGSAATNASGVATFSYTPSRAGTDTITAIVNNGTNNPSGSTTASIAPNTVPRRAISAVISCSSPSKHHLRCRITEAPHFRGLKVLLINGSGRVLGSALTNASGVAVITVSGLRSGSKQHVHGHVNGSGRTKPANSNTVTQRIK